MWAGLVLALSGCSGGFEAASVDGNEGTSEQAIYAGVTDSDGARNDSVVALKIGDSTQTFELCSASVIAPNVLLTARHCVSQNIVTSVACDQNGLSGNGDQVGADEVASTLHVYLGASPDLRTGVPVANGKQIFHTQTSALCNADIALVVLDRNIPGVTPLPVRLTAKTKAGETVRSVGYGENDKNLPVGTRLRKDGVQVLATGSTVSVNKTALASNEMEVGLSICQGDSGGPAISEQTGAVIGVVSRGASCTDNFGHIYTLTSGFASLFKQAFAAAGAKPIDEGAPVSAVDAGAGGANGGGNAGHGADAGSGVATGAGNADTTGGAARSATNLRAGAGAGSCSVRGGVGSESGDAACLALVAAALLARAGRARRRR